MLGLQLWRTGASSSGQKPLPRWMRTTNFQTVKQSSHVMENEDPIPKSIGRCHATSAPTRAAHQRLTVVCLDRREGGRGVWELDRRIRWRAAARLWPACRVAYSPEW
jgi:hypothetical protein